MTKYRVQFTEILPGSRTATRDDCVSGDLACAQAHLDQFAWIIESVVITEFVGSDATGRIVPNSEWSLDY